MTLHGGPSRNNDNCNCKSNGTANAKTREKGKSRSPPGMTSKKGNDKSKDRALFGRGLVDRAIDFVSGLRRLVR
jgi:hypothetical protein